MFDGAAHSSSHLLPNSPDTVAALKQLGDAMAADELAGPPDPHDSMTPAIFTYFGQFIDHDLTARTDRDTTASTIGQGEPVTPRDPDEVIASLHNGRRPQLDLDSVFGDGPSLAAGSVTESDDLYENNLKLRVFRAGARRDVPREDGTKKNQKRRSAIIGDARNDENTNISALHCAFLLFYNKIYDAQTAGTDVCKHIRARQLTRWAYQYIVVQDYLSRVCDLGIVIDTLANGPRFYGVSAGHGQTFMPLEFSTAAFRFGHTMIRPQYQLRAAGGLIDVMNLLAPSQSVNPDPFDDTANPDFFDDTDPVPFQLKPAAIVDFNFFAAGGTNTQMARKIDSNIAKGLGTLPLGTRKGDPILGHLAKSNLVRGYSLSVPTAQACCEAMGVKPLTVAQMGGTGESLSVKNVLETTALGQRTPLWYYILREAGAQQNGERLGELGSRIVCETIIGSLKSDPNSYLNARDLAVTPTGVNVDGMTVVGSLTDLINYSEAGPVGP